VAAEPAAGGRAPQPTGGGARRLSFRKHRRHGYSAAAAAACRRRLPPRGARVPPRTCAVWSGYGRRRCWCDKTLVKAALKDMILIKLACPVSESTSLPMTYSSNPSSRRSNRAALFPRRLGSLRHSTEPSMHMSEHRQATLCQPELNSCALLLGAGEGGYRATYRLPCSTRQVF